MEMFTSLDLSGFKSIRELKGLKLEPLNVLIGANGSGKSNLLSFFRMLSYMLAPSPGNLQEFVSRNGRASGLLHDGVATTQQITANLTFQTNNGLNEYYFRLFYAAPDTLIFADERLRFMPKGGNERKPLTPDSGHREAKLIVAAEQGDMTAKVALQFLKKCHLFQFHNTSIFSSLRSSWDIYDNHYLKAEGANLAPLLLHLRETQTRYYTRIVGTIRLIVPFFADFVLEPEGGKVLLQWHERGTDLVFGAHQASDGMLRAMALVTLLLQPEKDLPNVIIIDEPELGLHPAAIEIVAGLLQGVSRHAQIILATQSVTLLNYFEPKQIIAVDRIGRESTFKRLDENTLEPWLEEYSISDLWEKNVIGAKPLA